MVNWKVKGSCTLPLVIIMSANLDSIKKKGEAFTDGQENSRIFMKDNSSRVKEMEEAHFGGPMAAGMKAILKMVFSADLELYIARVDKKNTKGSGKTECSTEKVFNTSKMDNVMRVTSNRINSMEMVYFTKTTR